MNINSYMDVYLNDMKRNPSFSLIEWSLGNSLVRIQKVKKQMFFSLFENGKLVVFFNILNCVRRSENDIALAIYDLIDEKITEKPTLLGWN